MKVYENFCSDFVYEEKIVLALGMFDGVHIGHRSVLNIAKNIASERGIQFGVFTFKDHAEATLNYLQLLDCANESRCLLNSENYKTNVHDVSFYKNKQLIYDYCYRRELLKQIGADVVCEQIFTAEFANIAENYFPEFLLKLFPNLCGIVVGYDFRFGKNATGTAESLQHLCNNLNVYVAPPVEVDGLKVSSTRIRHELQLENLGFANKLLGENFVSCCTNFEFQINDRQCFVYCFLCYPVLLPVKKYLVVINIDSMSIAAVAHIFTSSSVKIEIDCTENNTTSDEIAEKIKQEKFIKLEWISEF